MSEFPETRESLLIQVRDPMNREAWEQFASIYRPVIVRLAHQRGLQDADAHDLAQRVLMAVASAIPSWEKKDESIRFRHWLRRVVRNAILNALSRQPKDRGVGGTSIQQLLDEHPATDDSQAELDLEYRREIYLRAAEIAESQVQSDTWAAFELTVIGGCSIEAAASELGKPIGMIYASRSRVMQRLRKIVQELEGFDS